MFQRRQTADVKGKGKADPSAGGDDGSGGKKVTFSDDTKPPAAGAPDAAATEKTNADAVVDGVVGQLEIYESGAVKMRLQNGIVMDVSLSRVHDISYVD